MDRLINNALLIFLSVIFSSLAQAEPTIGLLTELSGSFAINGANCRKGYELAVEQSHNDGLFRVIFGDSQGDPRAALSEMQKLINVDKAAVIVVNRSQVGMALASMADRYQVPLIGIMGQSNFVAQHPTAFRAWPNSRVEGEVLAKTAFRLGYRHVASVTVQDEYTESLTNNFTTSFKALGGALNSSIMIEPTELDFRTVILSLLNNKADAIFVNLGIPQLGIFYKKLSEIGVNTPTLTNNWVQQPEVLRMAGKRAEDAIFAEAELKIPNFLSLFETRFGEPSNLMLSYTCYAGATLAISSIHADSSTALSNLLGTTQISTLDGILPVLGREIQFNVVPKKIERGKPSAIIMPP